MNTIFLLLMLLLILTVCACAVAFIYYRRLLRLKKKYKYITGQLNLASSIYYGLSKNVSMPQPEENS